jgi:nucleotide-binding universal stress UspA family protein
MGDQAMGAFRSILVPTDYSKDAREAFRVAYDLAKPTGASVVMFHASRFPAPVWETDRQSPVPARIQSKDMRDELGKFPAEVPAVRLEHETVVADGPDAEHILRILEERGCDLIVMATRVRAGRKGRLFGSVTEDVVRRANCPVIVVAAPAGQSANSSEETVCEPARRVTA